MSWDEVRMAYTESVYRWRGLWWAEVYGPDATICDGPKWFLFSSRAESWAAVRRRERTRRAFRTRTRLLAERAARS